MNYPDEAVRQDAADEVALLTPVVKAFITDNVWVATSECMQVYGGHDFIAEWGMEQYVRDACINIIYEETSAIQSLDLLGPKVLMDKGAKLKKFGAKIQVFMEENGNDEALSELIVPLADLGDKVSKLKIEIGMKSFQNPDEAGAAAIPYLHVVGHLVYAYFFAKMAKDAKITNADCRRGTQPINGSSTVCNRCRDCVHLGSEWPYFGKRPILAGERAAS